MNPIDFSTLIPKYDYDKGGTVYLNYITLYQDFINEVISSNESIYSIFDCLNCEDKYLPYLAAFMGYSWDYLGDIEKQRYDIFSLVQRRKRVGTIWFFDDLFRNLGITYELRELVHHVLTLSGPETLDGDYYIQGLEKYHEGSIEFVVHHAEIPGLYDILLAANPAGVHLHLTYV